MQRLPSKTPFIALTDARNSSDRDFSPQPNKVVPDSFAEWLARPADTISAGPEPGQGVFMRLMNECCEQNFNRVPAKPGRR
jgi:hypothetical protein